MTAVEHAKITPEILAPAGDWEALRAAVANGADAVYFGLSQFNARYRATNFTLEELPQVMEFLHGRNVRGYVTCNTLIFSDELPEIAEYVAALARNKVDAVIVQDLGLVQLIRQLAPGLPIHGSTQMTLTETRGIEFVERLGVSRVILARELSAQDIRTITAESHLPVEVFVHGALCIAYSGQCLTSEALGGRSANRGQCAQACRLPYDLIVDGRHKDLGEQSYLVSPQDLAAPDLIADLVQNGVISFKIEGRLKSAQYVAATTQTYRAALDAALSHSSFSWNDQQQRDLAQSFSRGLSHGFLEGVNHQTLVEGRFPKSRGVKLGKVVDKTSTGVILELDPSISSDGPAPVQAGDGVVFDEGHPEQDEQGGRIYAVRFVTGQPRRVELTFAREQLNLSVLAVGCLVWKTDDPALRRRLSQSYNRDLIVHRRPLDLEVNGEIGGQLTLTFVTDRNGRVEVSWEGPLAEAKKHPLSESLLREQIGRLGDTPYELRNIQFANPAGLPVMVPKSVLNDLRRQAVTQLKALEEQVAAVTVRPEALQELRAGLKRFEKEESIPAEAQWYVLVRDLDQLATVLDWEPANGLRRPAAIYCDFEDIRGYEQAREKCAHAGIPLGLATVRIAKPKEEGWMRQIMGYAPDLILIRNLASLHFFQEQTPHIPLIGDYSLNITNELTTAIFAETGLQRLVPGYDLNWSQLKSLLQRFPASRFEQVIHQHMPMFHMEHCVFAATLSNGKDYRDCGRPCESHRVELRDRMGQLHPLLADVGCRNTLFNAEAQSAAEYVSRMLELGLRHFRVELLRQKPAEIPDLLNRYARLLAGQETGKSTWTQLRVLNQLGVTRGPLEFE
ncbi:MAG: DUF3656 domain-containing protein [Planctomycetales bacterium]